MVLRNEGVEIVALINIYGNVEILYSVKAVFMYRTHKFKSKMAKLTFSSSSHGPGWVENDAF